MKAEVLHAIRSEMAQTLTDLVFRRTELRRVGRPEDGLVKSCAAVMAKELDWNEVRTEREVQDVNAIASMWSLIS